MTIWAVQRAQFTIGDKEYDEAIMDVTKLKDGDHLIQHNGLQVPVTIKRDSVTIHLAKAKGNLVDGDIDGMGDDWSMQEKGDIKDLTISPSEGGAAMWIYGNPRLVLERHSNQPELFNLGKLK